MKTVIERLADLRTAMKETDCDIYIMPSSDPHSSEYAPEHFTAWEYFSGFQCENSTMTVTPSEAALWVDGRFFTAADSALKNTGIKSMHMGVKNVPSVYEWLNENLKENSVLGYDAYTMPLKNLRKLEKVCKEKKAVIKALPLVDKVWKKNRPALPATQIWILDDKYAGLSIKEKCDKVRKSLEAEQADAMLITRLDCIAWLLNLRAADVDDTPYALAFCYIDRDCAHLFTELSRIGAKPRKILEEAGVCLYSYDALPEFIRKINKQQKVMIEPAGINAALYNALKSNNLCEIKEEEENPISMMKAVKNETELKCTKEAHIFDGAAMVRFQIELEKRLKNGEKIRETDIDKILHKYRSESDKFITESFSTIAAWGKNAAMMHYFPKEGSDAELENRSFLLIDSGATYINGTTDITRTYALGELREADKIAYTRVLKCHIDLAMAIWKAGATGGELDVLAREPMWRYMLDYRCGTGHSVSHVGAVHEGPHSLRPHNNVAFVPGMVITDEPGIYEEGNIGIRIENELFCKEAGETEYGTFLCFEPLTYVPIDTKPIIPCLLNTEEKEWFNNYHKQVYEKISPLLSEKEKEWLSVKCQAI